jgi:hypothetical protein
VILLWSYPTEKFHLASFFHLLAFGWNSLARCLTIPAEIFTEISTLFLLFSFLLFDPFL